MPALGGYSPKSAFGELRGSKPSVPQIFFTLTEDEIAQVLMSQGFSEKTSKAEARKFMLYKERIVGPVQVWSEGHCVEHASFTPDCDKCQAAEEGINPEQPTEAPTKRFADEVASRKGGNES